VNTAPKLVLLDVGMVAELTPEDQHNLVGFFKVSLIRPPLVAPLLPPCCPLVRQPRTCFPVDSGMH